MYLKPDSGKWLTQAGLVEPKDRVFKQVAYLSSPEQAKEWREVTEMEKAQLVAQASALDTDNLAPEYLQEVETLIAAIPAAINTRGFTNEQALENKDWFPIWGDENAPMGMGVDAGFMFRHKAEGEAEYTLYKVLQPHTLSAEWVPGQGTESLYVKVSVHAGTIEDPIPYEQNMLIEEGKYYTQDGVLYIGLMTISNGYPYDLKDMPTVAKPVEEESEEPSGDGTAENPIAYVYNETVLENGKYYIQDGVKYLCIRDAGMPLAFNLADLVGAGYVEIAEETEGGAG